MPDYLSTKYLASILTSIDTNLKQIPQIASQTYVILEQNRALAKQKTFRKYLKQLSSEHEMLIQHFALLKIDTDQIDITHKKLLQYFCRLSIRKRRNLLVLHCYGPSSLLSSESQSHGSTLFHLLSQMNDQLFRLINQYQVKLETTIDRLHQLELAGKQRHLLKSEQKMLKVEADAKELCRRVLEKTTAGA